VTLTEFAKQDDANMGKDSATLAGYPMRPIVNGIAASLFVERRRSQ